MLVAAVISLVVLGVIFQLLVPSLSLFKSQMAFSQSHQSALLSAQRLKREITNTSVSTMTVSSDGYSVALAPRPGAAPFDSSGGGRYRSEFVIYFWDPTSQKLQQKRWPRGGDSVPSGTFGGPNPPRLSESQLGSIIGSVNGSERVIASNISVFSIQDSGSDPVLLEPPFQIAITCSVPTQSDKNEDYEVFLQVAPRSVEW